ncbi:MAG: ATP-binding protein [Bacteroidia bacterium]|nr:ATP-binding protein [Bacteroidia bacterium]
MLKIALVGPESTGKSTLSATLAEYYGTAFVPEYARNYIAGLTRPYLLEDIVHIAKSQLELEKSIELSSNKILFCDTNLLVTKIWAQNAFNCVPSFINENWKPKDYVLHLLMDVDIPWQPDPLREHPHLRSYLFEKYLTELKQEGANYKIIKGLGNERLEAAVNAVNEIVTQNSLGKL